MLDEFFFNQDKLRPKTIVKKVSLNAENEVKEKYSLREFKFDNYTK